MTTLRKILLVVMLLLLPHFSQAVVVLNWQQTGSDVTLSASGTIDAAWGSPNSYPNVIGAGFYDDAFSGFSPGMELRAGYGWSIGYDQYFLLGTSALPAFSLTGSQINGGIVQPGYLPGLFSLDIGSNYVALATSPSATSVDSSIVWSDKQLSDFFSSGVPVLSDIYNASSQKLLTVQIGNSAPVPEPGTWAAAAILVGGAGFMRWRKRMNDDNATAA